MKVICAACRDAVMLQHQLDLASSEVQLSVVDNLLVTHYPLLAQTAVYDLIIGSRQGLIQPQPLTILRDASHEVLQASRSFLCQFPAGSLVCILQYKAHLKAYFNECVYVPDAACASETQRP